MPRKCSICYHPKRVEIDSALLRGDKLTKISTDFNVSTESLRRHKRNLHIGRAVLGADDEGQLIQRGTDLFTQIDYWSGEVRKIYELAKRNDEKTVALNAIDKAMKLVALTSQMKQLFYETKATKEFQEEIIEILGEISQKARKEFIKRLQERRGIR